MTQHIHSIITLLFSALFFLGLPGKTSAQCGTCTPDLSIHEVGFFPNPLPPGQVGVPFDEVVQFVLEPETTITEPIVLIVPFDSIVLDNVLNVPAGLDWDCNIPSCSYPSASPDSIRGCVRICGTPTTPFGGTDSIMVIGTAWINVLGGSIPVTDTIRVGVSITVSVEEKLASIINLELAPNPISKDSKLSFDLPSANEVKIDLYNLQGTLLKEIAHQRFSAGPHSIPLNSFDFPAGVYFIKTHIGSESIGLIKRIVVIE